MVALNSDADGEVRATATATLTTLDRAVLSRLAVLPETPADVLGFLCFWPHASRELIEKIVFNLSTPDAALARLASHSRDSALIEAISLKQQSLIRCPEIIDAILTNPARTFEAERRAREVREEFFEKQFGAQMIAGEQRAQADVARRAPAAGETVSISGIEDLIRLGLIEEDVDDQLIAEYEEQFGPLDASSPPPEEQLELEQIVDEVATEEPALPIERMPVFQRVALMSVKERVMLAIKGTREARMILVRDPNRIVAGAVLRNPKLTDSEIENIASIKTVPEDVLRQIGQNRAWNRSYVVIHNLVRNPRTPIAISLSFINRIQTRDMRVLSQNKNIPDVIRQSAYRIYLKRSGS